MNFNINKVILLSNIIVLVFVLCGNKTSAAKPKTTENLLFDGYTPGTSLKQTNAGKFLLADITPIEARISLKSKALKLKYGGSLIWAQRHFMWNGIMQPGLSYIHSANIWG